MISLLHRRTGKNSAVRPPPRHWRTLTDVFGRIFQRSVCSLLVSDGARKHFLAGSRYGRRPNPTPNLALPPTLTLILSPTRAQNGPETGQKRCCAAFVFSFSCVVIPNCGTRIFPLALVMRVKFLEVSWEFPPIHSANTCGHECVQLCKMILYACVPVPTRLSRQSLLLYLPLLIVLRAVYSRYQKLCGLL